MINIGECNIKLTYGSPILRTHVGNGCPVCNAQLLHTRPVEFNKFPNDTNLPQVLGDGEHHVGGGDVISWTSSYFITNNLIQVFKNEQFINIKQRLHYLVE